jgi:hypothetical protein
MCHECDHVPPPVGEVCAHCAEVFFAADSGVVFLDGKAMHRNCFLRGIFGSVAHINGTCSCFVHGSAAGDPEGYTKREAADAAARALGFNDEELVCDFCSAREPLVRDVFPAGQLIGQFKNVINVLDSGVWGACAECAAVIDAQDYHALLERSIAGSLALNPSHSRATLLPRHKELLEMIFGVRL